MRVANRHSCRSLRRRLEEDRVRVLPTKLLAQLQSSAVASALSQAALGGGLLIEVTRRVVTDRQCVADGVVEVLPFGIEERSPVERGVRFGD